MRLVFADTFYWIALADYTDNSHQQALALTAELAACKIVTTDEVLTEYLNFFSTSIEPSRRQVVQSVRGILGSPSIIVVPQSRRSFLSPVIVMRPAPTKAIV
jgi:predicted nucleic acid-binding protein